MQLLRRVWVLDDHPFSGWLDGDHGLHGQVSQHFFRNPEDWSVGDLFERVGALDAVDKRFAVFLEGLVSAEVVPDVGAQHALVDVINTVLQQAGLELREIGEEGGYPVSGITSMRAARGRPKDLIFASQGKQLVSANRHRTTSATLDIEPPGDRTGSGFTGQLAIKVY